MLDIMIQLCYFWSGVYFQKNFKIMTRTCDFFHKTFIKSQNLFNNFWHGYCIPTRCAGYSHLTLVCSVPSERMVTSLGCDNGHKIYVTQRNVCSMVLVTPSHPRDRATGTIHADVHRAQNNIAEQNKITQP